MISWHEIPIFRIFLAFLTGIFIATGTYSTDYAPVYLFMPGICVFAAYLLWPDKVITYPTRWIVGVAIFYLFIILGYDVTIGRDPASKNNFLGRLKNDQKNILYQVRLLEPPQQTEKQIKLKIAVEKVFYQKNGGLHSFSINGNAICYLKKTEMPAELHYSDILLLKARFYPPPEALNPGSFDYKHYLKFKHTYHVTHCKQGDWKYIGHDKSHPLFELAYRWQAKLAQIFSKNGMKDEEYSVGAAMLLGKYENFSQELRNSYAAAGVTHILSVSGLHVGIVFIVFNQILFFLNGNKKLRLIKAALLIILTWFYALLTGLSPPVQRAAAMFTFLIAGKARNRNSNIINTLAASALLLLLIDPLLITDVGFELSYLAVLGIVVAGNPLYQLITPGNYLMDKLWQLVAISLGAQLLTGPVAVYYFHQFPTYFIPANMLIIPLSSVVMYIGMAVLVASPVSIICEWLTKLFTWSIELMNYLISLIERLPYASLKGLYIDIPQTCLLFVAGIFITFFIHFRKTWQLKISLATILIFILLTDIQSFKNSARKTIVVFAIRNGTAISFIDQKKQELILDSTALTGKDYLLSQTTNFSGVRGVRELVIKLTDTTRYFQQLNINGLTYINKFGKSIMLLDSAFNPFHSASRPLPVDILTLSGKIRLKPDEIFSYFKPGKVVICMSVKSWKSDQIKKACASRQIEYYDIASNGAFVLE